MLVRVMRRLVVVLLLMVRLWCSLVVCVRLNLFSLVSVVVVWLFFCWLVF